VTDLLGCKIPERAPKGAIPRWAARYGYSERAVKKFMDHGRKVGDMPPFDFPERMEGWAEKHLPQITKRFRQGVELAMGKSSQPASNEKAPEEPIDLPEVFESELGMENQLSGYRREFAMLAKLRENALRAGEFSRASNYFDQQQKVSSEIRQLEKALPLILEQRGDYQKTADMREAVTDFLTILKRSLLGRDAKASARLHAATSDAETREIWKAEIHAVFRECCENGFGEKLTLE
jgi:hypothetical protein